MKFKKFLIWVVAIVITIGAVLYQRTTGPTYERDETISFLDSTWEIELVRSSGERDARVKLPMKSMELSATLHYRKFRVDEEWTSVSFETKEIKYHSWFMTKVLGKEDEEALVAYLPMQPPAGKLQYFLELNAGDEKVFVAKDKPVVIRFKGDVPAGVLIPHIILMFMTMLFATVAGIYAISHIERFKRMTNWTFWLLLLGGFIFGPWVQWHAFGEWWAGIPFGWDLTDNKTLFALVFWVAAFFGNRKKSRPGLVILAAVMTLVIFSIPHSMFGSELDYSTGQVTQG
ncbi:MAG: hypothetical protein KAH17_05615 [Bacteroidales bacterium]|nr:hypothetical protein [Bacteroidales bacterium]